MNTSLAMATPLRHPRRMTGRDENEQELDLLARALKVMREEAGLTQEEAGQRAEPRLSKQAWGLHENRRAKQLLTPGIQSRLAAALGGTREDLLLIKDRIASMGSAYRPVPKAVRDLADRGREFEGALAMRQAQFPTRDGDVILSYPRDLTPEGLNDLESYFTLFIATARGRVRN